MIIEISKLLEHERTNSKHLGELKEEIRLDGILKRSIAVDKNTNIILDGHHRLHALKKLGYTKIPIIFIDYHTPKIIVQSWREEMEVTKDMVIEAGLTRKKLLPKTSKHMIRINGRLKHISVLERRVNVSLEKLR